MGGEQHEQRVAGRAGPGDAVLEEPERADGPVHHRHPRRISSDVPGADLAYTWHVPPIDPGAPGRAVSSRAGEVQPGRSSNRVTIRPPRHPPAAAVGDLDPDHAADGPDRDRDRLPLRARAAVPDAVAEQLTSSAASSPRGCPGPSTPAVNARATRARSARPATVTLSRIALAISAPAFPGPPASRETTRGRRRAHRDERPTQRYASSRETRRQRGPSVAVRETADGAHRP